MSPKLNWKAYWNIFKSFTNWKKIPIIPSLFINDLHKNAILFPELLCNFPEFPFYFPELPFFFPRSAFLFSRSAFLFLKNVLLFCRIAFQFSRSVFFIYCAFLFPRILNPPSTCYQVM